MEEKYRQIMERINRDNHFLQSSRMKVTDCGPGYATVQMDLDEQILNIYGMVHGGALFSLADTAAGAASFTTGRESVTLNASINFIKPGTGGKLKACATEIYAGKTTGVYEVFIYNDSGKLLSRATFTMFFIDKDRSKPSVPSQKETENETVLDKTECQKGTD